MITTRRAKERHHSKSRRREVWQTFRSDEPPDHFGDLELLNEIHLPPGALVPRHSAQASDLVTYVRQGALAYEDSRGNSGVIHAGEFQRRTWDPLESTCRHASLSIL